MVGRNNKGAGLKEYELKDEYRFRAIREWREDEKPREKLLKHGAERLTDAELLAILIRTGTKGVSAVDVARNLLDKYQNINDLADISVSLLSSVKGLGTAKAITIAAAFEIGKRIEATDFNSLVKVSSPADIAGYFIPKLRNKKVELFYVILLNTAGRVIKEVLISEGVLDASLVHPREVFKTAIIESAASIILLHNHPSGNLNPSNEDIVQTRELVKAGELLKIKVHDHILIAGNDYISFAELGLM